MIGKREKTGAEHLAPPQSQLSYEVSCERFTSLGFEFRGNLREGIGEIVQLISGVGRVNA